MRNIRAEHGERKERINFLTRAEVGDLLEAFQEHFPAHSPFVLLLVRTGLRLGEAVALEWGDIDFHDRFIRGRSAGVVAVGSHDFPPPACCENSRDFYGDSRGMESRLHVP